MDLAAFAEQLQVVEQRYQPVSLDDRAAYAKQLAEWRQKEPDSEVVCLTGDPTGAWLLLFLCVRYGIRTSRRARQKPTTFCVHAPRGFVDKVLWPQWREMVAVFDKARAMAVNELVTAWLGPRGGAVLFVDSDAPRSD